MQRLGDPDATLPLINAIVTKHEYVVTTGGSSGTPINFNAGGGPGQGGLGGLSVGGKTTKIKKDLNNDQVLSALTSLHGLDNLSLHKGLLNVRSNRSLSLQKTPMAIMVFTAAASQLPLAKGAKSLMTG